MTKHDWKVGERAIISARTDGTLSSLLIGSRVEICELDGKRYGVKFSTGFVMYLDAIDLEPLPAETPKDPFAPGEYVTCVKAGGPHSPNEGEVFLVDGYHHFDKDWFCALGKIGLKTEVLGYEKYRFRPATPEEIAAYKSEHEACDPRPEPFVAPYPEPRITFTVGGQEFYVGQRVWNKYGVEHNGKYLPPNEECEICAISHWGKSIITRRISDMTAVEFPPEEISTTPPAPHEWKRGDWARHEEFGECFVCSGVDFAGEVRVDFVGCSASVRYETLTFIKHIDLPS